MYNMAGKKIREIIADAKIAVSKNMPNLLRV